MDHISELSSKRDGNSSKRGLDSSPERKAYIRPATSHKTPKVDIQRPISGYLTQVSSNEKFSIRPPIERPCSRGFSFIST